jgi:hypothetical protein
VFRVESVRELSVTTKRNQLPVTDGATLTAARVSARCKAEAMDALAKRNLFLICTAAAFSVVGASVAAFMMYVAWQHNPQGEFHDDAGIHWLPWLGVGLTWFLAIAGLPCLIAVTVAVLRYASKRRCSN